MTNHTILFVDDDSLTLNTLTERFNHFGIEVYGAKTVDEAKDILNKLTPEIIILDILLEAKDGASAVMDFLKTQERLEHIPVLILTNLDQPETLKQNLLAQGAKEYIIKGSMSLDEIYHKVAGYLEPQINHN
jgi:DNA-binding response OmpR family regulator